MSLPDYKTYNTLPDVAFLVDGIGAEQGQDVTIASGQTVATTPTYRLLPGTVVVKDTASGDYYLADGATGDRNAPATVSASETADADWQSTTITVTLNGVQAAQVTLAASDDTDAEVVIALNADAAFAAVAVADESGGVVRIRALAADQVLLVSSSLADAFGTNGTSGTHTYADYAVIGFYAELQDIDGAAQKDIVQAYRRGHFRRSALTSLTADAEAALASRGSRIS